MRPGWGLRSKVLLVSICVIGALAIALALLLVYEKRSRQGILDISRESQNELIAEIVRNHTMALTAQMAESVTNSLYYFDLESIGEQLAFVKDLPGSVEALVFDSTGRIVHDGTRDISGYGTELANPLVREALGTNGTQVTVSDDDVETARRIRIGDQLLGGVLLRFNLTAFHRAAIVGNERLDQRLRQSTWLRVSSLSLLLAGVAILCLLATWLIQRRIVHPILRLAGTARQIESGAIRTSALDTGRQDEIGDLERAFDRMSIEINEIQRQTEKKAYVDQLTGLPNRRAFDETLASRINSADTTGEFALMFIDVDNLKTINDRLGHDAGDHALIDIANNASRILARESGGSAWMARIGGDEFAALCTGRPIVDAAMQLATAVIEHLHDDTQPADDTMPSVSIGIAIYPHHARTTSDLLKCADVAMYSAKRHGKNRILLYDPSSL